MFLDFIVDRLKEPSTYMGLGGLVAMFGWTVAPEQLSAITNAVAAVFAAVAVFLPERKA
jgi:hypothetical protein